MSVGNLTREFNAGCQFLLIIMKVNSSLPFDFLMSSSQTVGLVCVTGYFQWPQCECTVCLYVCLDRNERMCHPFLMENVRPHLLGFLVYVCVNQCAHMPLFLTSIWSRVVSVRGSKLSSTTLLFFVVLETLSRARSGDEVAITRYLLCD